jgi:hypothetical protein
MSTSECRISFESYCQFITLRSPMSEPIDKLWKEIWKRWSESSSIVEFPWEDIKLVKEYPKLEERIFKALTDENRFLVSRCLVVLEAIKSPRLHALPPQILERNDRIHLISGSFGSHYTVGQLARKIADRYAETKGEFRFDGGAVGVFLDTAPPKSQGLYRYEPYRSFSHYEVQTLLNKGEQPRCYYYNGLVRVNFTIRACPHYGVLDLSDFETNSDPSA